MKSKLQFLRRFKARTATLYPSAHSPRRELSAGVLNVTERARKVGFTMKLLSIFFAFFETFHFFYKILNKTWHERNEKIKL